MTTWRMRFECWIPKATNAHSEYVIIIVLYGYNGSTNASGCYIIRTLHVLLPLNELVTVTGQYSLNTGSSKKMDGI